MAATSKWMADELIIGHRIPVPEKQIRVVDHGKRYYSLEEDSQEERKGISRKISANEPTMCAQKQSQRVQFRITFRGWSGFPTESLASIRPSLTDEGLHLVEASIVFAVTPAKNKYLSFNQMEKMVSSRVCGNTRDTFEVVVPKGRDKSTWKQKFARGQRLKYV